MQNNLSPNPQITKVMGIPWTGVDGIFHFSPCVLSPPACHEMNKILSLPWSSQAAGEDRHINNYHMCNTGGWCMIGPWRQIPDTGWPSLEPCASIHPSDLFPVGPRGLRGLKSRKLCYVHDFLLHCGIILWGMSYSHAPTFTFYYVCWNSEIFKRYRRGQKCD